MTKLLDYFLDRVTMYRLVLYVLVGLVGVAAILAYVHLLSFSPLALLLSTAFLVVMCWAANSLLAAIFKVPTNVESVYITALILALILDSTPELALIIGNLYSYIVSPKHKVTLKLRRKSTIAASIVDFVFKSSHRLAYEPGQYMEFTLAHPRPDSRGNRRYFTLASSPTEENLRR